MRGGDGERWLIATRQLARHGLEAEAEAAHVARKQPAGALARGTAMFGWLWARRAMSLKLWGIWRLKVTDDLYRRMIVDNCCLRRLLA